MGALDRLISTRQAICRAATDCSRDPRAVRLVCVTKTFPADAALPLLEAGQRIFGENRVQEAAAKWPKLREKYPDIELHLIGPLQSNKTREAVELFDVIESVDREKIAKALSEEISRTGKRPRLLCRSTPAPSRKRPASFPNTPTVFWPPAATITV